MGSRRILKPARMQPLEIRRETMIASLGGTLKAMLVSPAGVLREFVTGNGIICGGPLEE